MLRRIWPEEYGHLSDEEIKAEFQTKRTHAKTALFRTMYGGGPVGMARQLGITEADARAIQEQLFRNAPLVMACIERFKQDAYTQGYVQGYTGRRRRLPNIYSPRPYDREVAERQAVNSPIQGLGADVTYMGEIKMEQWLRGVGLDALVTLLLTVHDSALYEVHDSVLERFAEAAPGVMLIRIPSAGTQEFVEFTVDVSVGKRWKGEPSLEALDVYVRTEATL
jgi:DNA polymerase-1